MSVENALYVVATPIGNLQDMVPRALAILQSVQLVAAEDTRHSGILLNHFGISTKTVSYHDYSSDHDHRSADYLNDDDSIGNR